MFALALLDHRRQQHQPLAFRQRQHLIHHLADGLGVEVNAVIGTARKAADRHVGDRQEAVEDDAVSQLQLALVVALERGLVAGEEGPHRVVDEVEHEPLALPVAGLVQQAQGLQALREDPVAPLRVGTGRAERGERRGHLDAVLAQEAEEVALRGQQQHGEVAAVDDAPAQREGLRHQEAELRVELRRPAGDVEGGDPGLPAQELHDLLGRLAADHLAAVGAGVHVAVGAGLVAELADVDLQDLDRVGLERGPPVAGEHILEGGGAASLERAICAAGKESS